MLKEIKWCKKRKVIGVMTHHFLYKSDEDFDFLRAQIKAIKALPDIDIVKMENVYN